MGRKKDLGGEWRGDSCGGGGGGGEGGGGGGRRGNVTYPTIFLYLILHVQTTTKFEMANTLKIGGGTNREYGDRAYDVARLTRESL